MNYYVFSCVVFFPRHLFLQVFNAMSMTMVFAYLPKLVKVEKNTSANSFIISHPTNVFFVIGWKLKW